MGLQTELNFNSESANNGWTDGFGDINKFGMVTDGGDIVNGVYGGNLSEYDGPTYTAFGEYDDATGFVGKEVDFTADGDKTGEGCRFLGSPGYRFLEFLATQGHDINHVKQFDLNFVHHMGLYGGYYMENVRDTAVTGSWDSNNFSMEDSLPFKDGAPFVKPTIEYMRQFVSDNDTITITRRFLDEEYIIDGGAPDWERSNIPDSDERRYDRLFNLRHGILVGPNCSYVGVVIRSYIQDWLSIGSLTSGERPNDLPDYITDDIYKTHYSMLPSDRGIANFAPGVETTWLPQHRDSSYYMRYLNSLYTYIDGRTTIPEFSPLDRGRFDGANPTTADTLVRNSMEYELARIEALSILNMKVEIEKDLTTLNAEFSRLMAEVQDPHTRNIITMPDNTFALVDYRPFHFRQKTHE